MELVLPRTRSLRALVLLGTVWTCPWKNPVPWYWVPGKDTFNLHPIFYNFHEGQYILNRTIFLHMDKEKKKNWPDMLGNHSCCNQPRIHHNGIHWRVPYKHIGHRQHNFLLRTHPCYIDKLKNRQFCGLLLHRMQKWIEERSLEEFLDHEFHFLM